ncbi:hypothetical protein D3C85_1854680 [compost metagenome]
MLEGLAERLAGILHDLHGVRHDEAPDAGAADDDELERLGEDFEMSAHGHVAAKDTTESYDQTDDDVHC